MAKPEFVVYVLLIEFSREPEINPEQCGISDSGWSPF
jgi:hypothetical protein